MQKQIEAAASIRENVVFAFEAIFPLRCITYNVLH